MKYAFPKPDLYEDGYRVEIGESGMTLRDYFASHALVGLLSSGKLALLEEKTYITDRAYRYADAMIDSRKEAQ